MRERRGPADLLARQIFPALGGNDQRTVRRKHAFFQEKGEIRARGEHGALPVHLAADDGKLRDDAVQLGRLAEQLRQTFQGGHALSDLHAAAVQDVHDRGRIFLCERKHPKHLFAARFADAAVQDGKILRGNIDGIPVDRCKTAHNAFTRRFREVMGITPHHYLQEIRYALAAQLLESTSLTIGEICEKIGIRDPFHFSREFKRYHERSPSLYRKVRQGTAKM